MRHINKIYTLKFIIKFLIEAGEKKRRNYYKVVRMSKLKCSGMQNIINGFVRYRLKLRGELLKTFETVRDHPHVS